MQNIKILCQEVTYSQLPKSYLYISGSNVYLEVRLELKFAHVHIFLHYNNAPVSPQMRREAVARVEEHPLALDERV